MNETLTLTTIESVTLSSFTQSPPMNTVSMGPMLQKIEVSATVTFFSIVKLVVYITSIAPRLTNIAHLLTPAMLRMLFVFGGRLQFV